jgi:REP element-mobilizing transposase RayT
MAAGLATLARHPGWNPMRARGQHQACRLFFHLTWHTYRHEPVISAAVAPIVTDSVGRAARRTRSLVLAQGVLSDHIHLLIRCAPDATISAFVREAKSESSRRVGKALRWQRGYFADSISYSDVIGVRRYIASQFTRHPDKIPPG